MLFSLMDISKYNNNKNNPFLCRLQQQRLLQKQFQIVFVLHAFLRFDFILFIFNVFGWIVDTLESFVVFTFILFFFLEAASKRILLKYIFLFFTMLSGFSIILYLFAVAYSALKLKSIFWIGFMAENTVYVSSIVALLLAKLKTVQSNMKHEKKMKKKRKTNERKNAT